MTISNVKELEHYFFKAAIPRLRTNIMSPSSDRLFAGLEYEYEQLRGLGYRYASGVAEIMRVAKKGPLYPQSQYDTGDRLSSAYKLAVAEGDTAAVGKIEKDVRIGVDALLTLLYHLRAISILKLLTEFDDRLGIHANKSITGRMAFTGINMHGIPKKDTVRRVFVADNTFVSRDFSMMDLTTLAALSGDVALRYNIHDGVDVYGVVGSECGVDRDVAKKFILASLYGAGSKTKALAAGSYVTARDLGESFWGRYSTARDYIKELQKKTAVVTPRGRSIPSTKGEQLAPYTAASHMIQGAGSDMFKYAVLWTMKELRDMEIPYRLAHLIHDEIIIDCDDTSAALYATQRGFEEGARWAFGDVAVGLFRSKIATGSDWAELTNGGKHYDN